MQKHEISIPGTKINKNLIYTQINSELLELKNKEKDYNLLRTQIAD